jgi:hypothetical protein
MTSRNFLFFFTMKIFSSSGNLQQGIMGPDTHVRRKYNSQQQNILMTAFYLPIGLGPVQRWYAADHLWTGQMAICHTAMAVLDRTSVTGQRTASLWKYNLKLEESLKWLELLEVIISRPYNI